MPRPIKTSAVFRNEIAVLVQSLGNVGEQRVRNAFRQYKSLEMKKIRRQTPLTAEEIQLLKDSPLRNDYSIGQQLNKLETKLRAREKKEKKANSLAAVAAKTNHAASVSITNRVSTHQSRPTSSTYATNSTNPTVFKSPSPNSNSTYSSLAAPSSTIY